MISKKCKYALRSILFLATESNEGHALKIKAISEKLDMPSPFLAKILQELVPKSIISSIKGPKGGFYISEDNASVSLIEIVKAIDGDAFFKSCGLGLSDCSDDEPCPLHHEFKIARDHLQRMFSDKTVADVATDIAAQEFILFR